MHRLRPAALAAALSLALCGAALPAAAQDLTYTTTTKMEISGTLGRILSVLGKMDEPMVEKTYLQGSRVRKDQEEETSSILDWDAGTMTLLDHPDRTFMHVDFARMAEQMAGAMEQQPEAGQAPEVEVTMTADRTGKTETIAGYAAEQVIITVQMKPKDPEAAAAQPWTALVTELWLSTDFPEYRMMQERQGEAIERLHEGGAAESVAQAMGALAASNPAMKEGWEKNMEAMKDLRGTALRSTTHFVSVPPGAELDREKVLASAGEAVSEGGGMAQGAANAARQALSGLAGRLGRGRPQQQPEQAAPAQAVIMRVWTEISDVGTGAVDPSLFQVPEGYTERTPPGVR